MVSNVIGFIGIDNYDIILYLSRILNTIGKKVLIIDYSYTDALTTCIPVPEGLNVYDDIIDYRDVDYTKKCFEEDYLNEYDDILINFGFHYIEHVAAVCNYIIYSTDLQKHNIDSLRSIPFIRDGKKQLIIRDMVDSKINPTYIIDLLQMEFLKDDVYGFELDALDMKYKILIQYDTIFEFKRITKYLKSYLTDTLKKLYPNIAHKELREALKKAERGN